MELLEKRILSDGVVLPGNVLKVGSFLNQQIDVELLALLGGEIARLFRESRVTKVLTIEASGIALAAFAAAELRVPVVFAKKTPSSNQSSEVFRTPIVSYTHKNTYMAAVAKEYLSASDRVLIVDDFLATGEALEGLIRITEEAGAFLTGCAVAVEKGFQGGGDSLRRRGIRVEALALIDRMTDREIVFRHEKV